MAALANEGDSNRCMGTWNVYNWMRAAPTTTSLISFVSELEFCHAVRYIAFSRGKVLNLELCAAYNF